MCNMRAASDERMNVEETYPGRTKLTRVKASRSKPHGLISRGVPLALVCSDGINEIKYLPPWVEFSIISA